MSTKPRKDVVSVIGGGSWGSCLAHIIASNGFPVKLWIRRQDQAQEILEKRTNSRYLGERLLSGLIQPTTDLESAAASSILVMAIPSKAFREISRQLGDRLQPDQIVFSATKGIEPQSSFSMSEIIKQETACLKVGAISGPNLALEVMDGSPSATIVASRYEEVVAAGMQILNRPSFRAYGSQDLIGVEMAGALKNVIALVSGMVTGLGYGANTRAFLIARGLSEMIRLGRHTQADPQTFAGLAGVGDLVVTCSSEQSRNFRVGKALGEGKSLDEILAGLQQVAEGVRTAKSAFEMTQKFKEDLPIMDTVYRILYEGLPIQEAKGRLLGRPMHFEHQPERIIPERRSPEPRAS